MIKKFIYHYWEVFIIFLLSLTPLLWLHHGEVILGHDSGFRFDSAKYLQQVWFSWNPLVKMGTDLSNYKGFLIALLPESLFVRLTGSLSVGQTMNFVFWFFVMGMGMYICLKSFFPEKKYWPFRLTASTFYMYNFFLLQGWFITERAKFSLFAALPILFAISWKTVDGKYTYIKGGILFGLTLFFLNGGGSPPLYGGILVSQAVLVSFFLGQAIWKKQIPDVFHVVITMMSFSFCTFLFNAYWLIPQAYIGLTQYSSQLTGMGGFAGILSWENAVSKYASFTNLLRLQGVPDWYDNPLHPYAHVYLTNPLLIITSFFPLVTVLIVMVRKNIWKPYIQYRQFFFLCLLLLLVGLVMTAGSHAPTGFLYIAFLRYIPGFLIFRTAFYKFGPAVWFSLIVLSSFACFILTARLIQKRMLYVSVHVVLLIGILAYHFPYFSGNFFVWNKPFSTKVAVPGYVDDMFSYMNKNHSDDNSRTMILPPLDTSFHADSYTWGFWSLDVLPKLGSSVSVIDNDGDSPLIKGLYDAALRNNSYLFDNLAARIGINKILWRDDVLYTDKTTKSDNFRFLKDSLFVNSGISKEKSIGEWAIYDILKTESVRQVNIETALYRADVDPSMMREFYGSVDVGTTPIFVGDSIKNDNLAKKLEPFIQGNIYPATCVFCDPSELKQIENIFPAIYIRFLPDSPLYSLVKWKEKNILDSLASSPLEQIDADLAFAAKRLAEVWGLMDRDSRDNRSAIDSLTLKSFIGFKERVDHAIVTVSTLDEINQNRYKARIGAYLKFYVKYLAKIGEKYVLSENISVLYEYLSMKSHELSENAWITDSLSLQKFYLTIPIEDIYELVISKGIAEPTSIYIDGQNITDIKSVHLKAGVHKLALHFASNNEIASDDGSVNTEIPLVYGQQKIFDVPTISSEGKYIIRFDYRVTKGRSIYIAFHQDNDSKDVMGNIKRVLVEPLKDDGVWHSAEYVLQSNFGAQRAKLVFFTADSTDEQSSVSISELMVQNIKPVNIFAIKHRAILLEKANDISYQNINPAVYGVSINNAPDKYILNFKQSFDVGWKVFIVPYGHAKKYRSLLNLLSLFFKKPVDSANHFSLDTVTNAWHIDSVGSYDMVIVYFPYIIFLIAACCSGISILIGFLILVKSYIRRP